MFSHFCLYLDLLVKNFAVGATLNKCSCTKTWKFFQWLDIPGVKWGVTGPQGLGNPWISTIFLQPKGVVEIFSYSHKINISQPVRPRRSLQNLLTPTTWRITTTSQRRVKSTSDALLRLPNKWVKSSRTVESMFELDRTVKKKAYNNSCLFVKLLQVQGVNRDFLQRHYYVVLLQG